MAKHIVKCPYCEKQFDANKEPYVLVQKGHRYAHQSCYEKNYAQMDKAQKDEQALRKYILELFGSTKVSEKVEHQLKTFREKGYTYSGMLGTLKYFFEVKRNSLEKANGGIGIIPYVYDQAREYWLNLTITREKNEELTKMITNSGSVMEIKEIHIVSPERQPMRHKRKLFTFLNEEEDDCGQE